MHSVKLFITVLILISSCKKSVVPTENFYISFTALLKGSNEIPPNASAATGTATVTYNKTTRILKVNVAWTSVIATKVIIYKGAAGVTGTSVFTLNGVISPVNYTSVALSDAQETDLLANLYYINIHSTAYPNGEIRGQLIKQ